VVALTPPFKDRQEQARARVELKTGEHAAMGADDQIELVAVVRPRVGRGARYRVFSDQDARLLLSEAGSHSTKVVLQHLVHPAAHVPDPAAREHAYVRLSVAGDRVGKLVQGSGRADRPQVRGDSALGHQRVAVDPDRSRVGPLGKADGKRLYSR
jgi:hypothetical protein